MTLYRKCPSCLEYFEASRETQVFCNSKCRLKHFKLRHPNYYQRYKEKREKTLKK